MRSHQAAAAATAATAANSHHQPPAESRSGNSHASRRAKKATADEPTSARIPQRWAPARNKGAKPRADVMPSKTHSQAGTDSSSAAMTSNTEKPVAAKGTSP